jgi:hypothetical protein
LVAGIIVAALTHRRSFVDNVCLAFPVLLQVKSAAARAFIEQLDAAARPEPVRVSDAALCASTCGAFLTGSEAVNAHGS